MDALQGYIDRTKSSFEMYLADQYEVAENARLETLRTARSCWSCARTRIPSLTPSPTLSRPV